MNLLNENELVKKIGVTRQTIYVWRKHKGFPAPKNVCGVKKNLWLENEVEEWLAKNLEAA